MRWALFSALSFGTCAAAIAMPRDFLGAVRSGVYTGTVASRAGADTLEMTVTWTLPTDDGRGPLDSLRVAFFGIQRDTSVVLYPPLPTTFTWRHAIPLAAYQLPQPITPTCPSCVSQYSVFAAVTTFRHGQNAPPVKSGEVIITLTDTPPPVTGVTLQARKIP